MNTRTTEKTEREDGSKQSVTDTRPVGLTVRLASSSDLVPLTFFFDAILRNDYFIRRGQLADILNGNHHQVYVAELDAILVGVAVTTRGSQLVNVLVHPSYRGLGIGRALVYSSGAVSVRAKLDMSTGDPRDFYASLGFEPTGSFNQRGNIEVMRMPEGAVTADNAQNSKTNGKRPNRLCDKRGRRRNSTGK